MFGEPWLAMGSGSVAIRRWSGRTQWNITLTHEGKLGMMRKVLNLDLLEVDGTPEMRFAFWGCWFCFFWQCGSSINSIQWYFCIKFAYLLFDYSFWSYTILESIGIRGSICHKNRGVTHCFASWELCQLRCHRWPLRCWFQASPVWTCLCHPRINDWRREDVALQCQCVTTGLRQTTSRVRLWRRTIAPKQALRTWHPSCAASCETRIFLTLFFLSFFDFQANSFQGCVEF